MDNIDDLADDISKYLDTFAKATDAIQKDILKRLEVFIKDLEVKEKGIFFVHDTFCIWLHYTVHID